MEKIDLDRALPKIAELLDTAFAGEEIVITQGDRQSIKIAKVASVSAPHSPRFGCDRDRVTISDDFDLPLDEFQDYM